MRRRMILRWIPVAAVALASLFATAAAPVSASAASAQIACPAIYPVPAYCHGPLYSEPALAGLKHTGWVYLNLNYCPPGYACAAVVTPDMPAWSWSGTAWRPATLRGGWVYVYPYTGEWRWAWTQSSGWVAVTGGRFERRPF